MGRPAKKISSKEVFELAKDGCKNTEIAEYFGVSADTIERRFAGELTKGRASRNISLRRTQLAAAKQGNSAMLVWLGKQYLGQSDSMIDQYLIDAIKNAGITKEDLITLIQKKDLINPEKPKKTFEEFCASAEYPSPYPKQVEMMQFGIHETVPRILLGAPGCGKTDYVVIMGTAYDIYLNPLTSTNLLMTKSKERNTALVNQVAEALEANGVMLEMRNSTQIRVAGLQGKDASFASITVKAVSLRGRHPKRIIMEDVVTEDDSSEATRALAEKKYYEVLKRTSNVLIVGQPAHKFDLYAKLRGILKNMEVAHADVPEELQHDLEAMRLAGMDEASLSASYQLKILSEGTTPFDNIKYIDKFPGGESAVAFIDPSHEGGDYTALTILNKYMQGVAIVGFVYKKAWNHCLDDMAKELKRFNVRKLAFETNALGDMPIEILRKQYAGIGIIGRRSNTNKHSRIMAAGGFAHLMHLSKESSKQYIDHVVQYEYKAKYDDAPDSLASCLQWVGLIRGKE